MSTSPKTLTANGIRFAYLEEGEGPLVLLVHGFPDTAHTWDEVRPALARAGYRAASPFTRGYAPSSAPPRDAYDADTLGRDVLAIIEALGEERAIVVGHDFGAGAAYSAAELGPERVSLLVTVAIPHPASVVPTPSILWAVRHFFTLRLPWAASKARAKTTSRTSTRSVRRWSPGWDVPPSETDEVKRSFREPGSLEAALGYYRALRPTLPPGQRKRISVPTVAFAGLDDVVAPAAYERARSRFTGTYEVVTMPGSHFMHRQHPARFIEELLGALARHAPPTIGAKQRT